MSLELDDIIVSECHSEYVDRLIQRNHYLDTVPSPPCIYRYLITGGIMHGIVGAAMWGKPIARMEDQEDTLELLRFWTEDYTPKNTESYAIGQMIQDIDSKDTHTVDSLCQHERRSRRNNIQSNELGASWFF